MKGLVVRNNKLSIVDDLPHAKAGPGEITVKVAYASVNPTDVEFIEGVFDKHIESIGRLDLPRSGLEFSGIANSDGKQFKKGDAVFGYIDLMNGEKTHQEEIAINEDFIAAKPENVTFADAAAFPLGALTSLIALRDVAKAQPGERLLINGAGGGLGVYAIQLASKRLGLHITAIAGANQKEFLEDLGAHVVLDYNKTDITKADEKFDVIFDLTTRMQFSEIESILSPTGRFMPSEPAKSGVDYSEGAYSGSRSVSLWVPNGNREILTELADHVSKGELRVFVDSVFAFSDYEKALARLGESGRRGRILLDMQS